MSIDGLSPNYLECTVLSEKIPKMITLFCELQRYVRVGWYGIKNSKTYILSLPLFVGLGKK